MTGRNTASISTKKTTYRHPRQENEVGKRERSNTRRRRRYRTEGREGGFNEWRGDGGLFEGVRTAMDVPGSDRMAGPGERDMEKMGKPGDNGAKRVTHSSSETSTDTSVRKGDSGV